MPAPPPESEPAIDSTRGVRRPAATQSRMPGRAPLVGADPGAHDESARFERAQGSPDLARCEPGGLRDRARVRAALDELEHTALARRESVRIGLEGSCQASGAA